MCFSRLENVTLSLLNIIENQRIFNYWSNINQFDANLFVNELRKFLYEVSVLKQFVAERLIKSKKFSIVICPTI